MKSSFGEALESFLYSRDRMKIILSDHNSSESLRGYSIASYDHRLRLLEDAHKLSLFNVISGENHEETQ